MIVLYTNLISLCYAISIVSYSALIYTFYLVLKGCKPKVFANTSDNEIEGLDYGGSGFLDCSFLYKLFPCNSCSFRKCWRKHLPASKLSVLAIANCECIRPTIHGSPPYKIDLICCRV